MSWRKRDFSCPCIIGVARKGKKLVPPMPYDYFKDLTPEDLDAIVAYVRTFPPIKKLIEPNPPLETYLKK